MAVVPMGPAPVDLTGVRAGDQNQVTVSLSVGGLPLDLTGYEVTAQARPKANDNETVLDAVVEVIDAATGQLVLRWPGEDVRVLMNGSTTWSGVWDLQIQAGTDDALTVIAGKFKAVMDVTRT